MSIAAMDRARLVGQQMKLSAPVRAVIRELANCLSRTGKCCPGQPYIADWTGHTVKTVRAALLKAADLELIKIKEHPGRPTHYELLFLADTPVKTATVDPGKTAPATPVKRPLVTPVKATPAPRQNGHADPGKNVSEPRAVLPETPVKPPPEPYLNQERTQGSLSRARAPARLPDDWVPSERHIVFGTSVGLTVADIAFEADRMRDWAAAKAETCHDWDARFRNWLRKEASDRNRANRRPAAVAVSQPRPRTWLENQQAVGDMLIEMRAWADRPKETLN